MTDDSIICCPCPNKSNLNYIDGKYVCDKTCQSGGCKNFTFEVFKNIPILINSSATDTICSVDNTKDSIINFTGVPRKYSILKSFFSILISPTSRRTKSNIDEFIKLIRLNSTNARVLIIGSGTIGSGTSSLYNATDLKLTGIDVYYSDSVDYIADAHYLPFISEIFDGVLIQAVLEHVVDPNQVVNEIYRVLKSNGICYSEIPFMQQVHEGAYDFSRFTVLGHRYLFKNFQQLRIGGDRGSGTVLAWSIKYFIWSLFRSRLIATILAAPFFIILNIFDLILDKNSLFDSCSGSFFLGKKSNCIISHSDLPGIYSGMQ